MRTFVRLREMLSSNAALLQRLNELENEMIRGSGLSSRQSDN
jgi:hypothetical protein